MCSFTVRSPTDGRITIPISFRRFAVLEQKVLIIGAGTRAEVWSPERWLKRYGDSGADLGPLFQKVYDQQFRRDVNLKKRDD